MSIVDFIAVEMPSFPLLCAASLLLRVCFLFFIYPSRLSDLLFDYDHSNLFYLLFQCFPDHFSQFFDRFSGRHQNQPEKTGNHAGKKAEKSRKYEKDPPTEQQNIKKHPQNQCRQHIPPDLPIIPITEHQKHKNPGEHPVKKVFCCDKPAPVRKSSAKRTQDIVAQHDTCSFCKGQHKKEGLCCDHRVHYRNSRPRKEVSFPFSPFCSE